MGFRDPASEFRVWGLLFGLGDTSILVGPIMAFGRQYGASIQSTTHVLVSVFCDPAS